MLERRRHESDEHENREQDWRTKRPADAAVP